MARHSWSYWIALTPPVLKKVRLRSDLFSWLAKDESAPGLVQRKDVAEVRVAATGEHVGVGGRHRLGSLVPLHHQPGLPGLAHGAEESLPCLKQALAKQVRAPFAAALLDLRRGEEEGRPRTRKIARAAELVDVRAADGAAVFKVGEARVDILAQGGIAGKIDVNAGRVGGDLVKPSIVEDPVVAPQALAESHVRRRGQSDQFDALALRQHEGSAPGGFARCAGEQHDGVAGVVGAEEVVVRQEVVDQPRGDEQRSQQRLLVLGLRGVERIAGTAQVAVVDRMQCGPMGGAVREARGG